MKHDMEEKWPTTFLWNI